MIVNYMIKDIYRVIGTLEGLTMMQGQTLNEAMVTVLGECVDKLEMVGCQLTYNANKDVNTDDGKAKIGFADKNTEGTTD